MVTKLHWGHTTGFQSVDKGECYPEALSQIEGAGEGPQVATGLHCGPGPKIHLAVAGSGKAFCLMLSW